MREGGDETREGGPGHTETPAPHHFPEEEGYESSPRE